MQKPKSFECARISLLVLNTILSIMGVVLIGLAIFLHAYDKGLNQILVVSSAIGALMSIVVAIVGFVGVCKMNTCVLIAYFTLQVILFSLHISAAVLSFRFKYEVTDYSFQQLLKYFGEPFLEEHFDTVQEWWNCCGLDYPGDYIDIEHDSCCDVSGCRTDRHSCSDVYMFLSIGTILIVLGVLQLFMMATSMVMICWLRRYEKIDGTDEE